MREGLLRFAWVAGLCLALLGSTASADLVASVRLQANPDPQNDQQSHTGLASRDDGAVIGTVAMMAGHEVGANSYTGIDISVWSGNTQYKDMNRYGTDVRGGLITWDFDLSSYLAGKSIGSEVGDSQFSLDIDYSNRRTGTGAYAAPWFISYNGGGLSLDTSDITTHTVSGNTSGVENYDLVNDTSLYKPTLILPAAEGASMHSVDITADIAAIAAGDGLIRIAFLEGEYYGDIHIYEDSGIVESVIPEPGTLVLLGLGGLALGLRRRR